MQRLQFLPRGEDEYSQERQTERARMVAQCGADPRKRQGEVGVCDHYFTVVFQAIAYYRWVVSDRKVKNGMSSCSVYIANSYKS